MSQSPKKRLRPSTRSTSSIVVSCLLCKQPQVNVVALDQHCQIKHTKKQMIEAILKIADKSPLEIITHQSVEDETSNSNKDATPSPVRVTRRTSIEAISTSRNYNFRTPSTATILKQRNSLMLTSSPSLSPCNSTTSNSNSPSPYFTPEQSFKRTRRRKQRLDSLMLDIEDDASKSSAICNLMKLPPCSEIKEGIRKLKEQADDDRKNLSISKLDSDTDSCSDMAMPSVYCSFCSNGYTAIDDLEQHISECPKKDIDEEKDSPISIEPLKIYVCYFCDQEFNVKLTLTDHLSEHLTENVMTDIIQLENDFDLRPETNYIYQYFNYFTAGYNFGVIDKGSCTKAFLHYKFYETLFQDNQYNAMNLNGKN